MLAELAARAGPFFKSGAKVQQKNEATKKVTSPVSKK